MKNVNTLILAISISLFGCMKSQISDSLVVQANEKQFSMATVLAVESKLKFISGEKFRDTFYPWFEPNTAPDGIAELSAILSKTLVRKRIEALGIELLIYVHGDTHQSVLHGDVGGYGVAVGYAAAERETHISTTVWDLRKMALVGDTDVHFQGTVHIPVIGIPFVIPAFTESSACSETTKRISNCLTGEVSHKDK
jgi:hypothetical protein